MIWESNFSLDLGLIAMIGESRIIRKEVETI